MRDDVAGFDGVNEWLGLAPEREGQAREMFNPPGNPGGDVRRKLGHWYSPAAVREFLVKDRERSRVLTDDMLRYAMAAMGTGSPKDAEWLRLFWRFAMEARDTEPNARGKPPKVAKAKRYATCK